jgi:Ca-activated chloride channel family protein
LNHRPGSFVSAGKTAFAQRRRSLFSPNPNPNPNRMKNIPLIRLLLAFAALFFTHNNEARAQQTGEPARVIIVFDASGSMAGQVEGRAKIDVAKEVVSGIVEGIAPEVELGLMAYGHRRKGDCDDIELLVSPAPGSSGEVLAAIMKLNPIGKTPLTAAVLQAASHLKYIESKASVILVSDGEETCDMDPCLAAMELEAAGLDFTCHVVGFDIKAGETAGLECLAKKTGGLYLSANNADTLTNALQEAVKQVMKPSTIIVAEPRLASGGPIIEGVNFRLTTAAGEEVAAGNGGRWSHELAAEGQFIIVAEREGKEVKVEAKAIAGQTTTYEVVFAATGVKAVAYDKEGGVAFESGVAWTLYGPADAGGQREQVAFSYDGRPFLRVDPGSYLLRAETGSAVAERELTVAEGAPLEVSVILGSGTLKLAATVKTGEAPLTKDLAWDILSPADAEGDRKSVSISYDAQPNLTIPAGKYLARVKHGDAVGQAEVEIKAGEVTEVLISLESGRIVATAAMEEGGAAIESDLAWYIFGEADLEGKREDITFSYDARPEFSLPSGTYTIEVRHGSAKASREVTVVAGESVKVDLTLGAGKVRLVARPAAGAKPFEADLVWNLFGEADLEGNREDVAYSYESNPTLSVPAGTYLLKVVWGEARAEREVVVESGKLADIEMVLNAGTVKANAVMGEGGQPVSGNLAWTLFTEADAEGNRADAGFSYNDEADFRNAAGRYLLKLTRGSATAEQVVEVTPNKMTKVTLNLNAGILKVSARGEGMWTILGVPANGEDEMTDLGFSYDKEATFYLPAGKVIVRRSHNDDKADKEIEIGINKSHEVSLEAK